MIVPEFTEKQLEDCVQWFTDLDNYGKTIADNTYMIFELFCTVSRLGAGQPHPELIIRSEKAPIRKQWHGRALADVAICL